MPTPEQIQEFKTAFNKLDTQGDQADMDLESQTDTNNAKLKATVNKLIAQLKKNIYKAHVSTETGAIETLVTQADQNTNKSPTPDHDAAFAKLKEAREKAVAAMGYLDKYAKFVLKLNKAQGSVDSLKLNDAAVRIINEAKSAASSHDYVTADSKIESLNNAIKPIIQREYINVVKPRIDKLEEDNTELKEKIKDYLRTPLNEINTSFGALNRAKDAVESKQAYLEFIKIYRLLKMAEKLVPRREVFEVQLTATKLAIAGLDEFSTVKVIKDKQDALKDPDLKNAKDLASIEKRQIEIGVGKLKEIEAEAKTLKTYGAACKTYATEAPKVQTAFENDIRGHENKNEAIVAAVKGLIDQATELAKDPATTAAANVLLEQAKRDTAAAKMTFDASKDLAGIQSVDENSAAGALQKLKDNYKTAKGHSHKDVIEGTGKELTVFVTKYGEDLATLDGKVTRKDDGYLDELKSAATALDTILLILSQQAGYKADLEKLENCKGTLNSATEKPNILAKITALEGAITTLKQKHEAKDWAARASALKDAEEKAAEAEETLKLRKTYDSRVQTINTRLTACDLSTSEPNDKKEVTDLLAGAADKAKNPSLDFKAANKKLDKAVAKMEGFAVKKQIGAGDIDKVKEAAKKMMENGSAKELDELIQGLPDTVGPSVIEALASERFGLSLEIEVGGDTGFVIFGTRFFGEAGADEATKTAKRMLETMALVSDHVLKNPSIETVQRLDPNSSGGSYNWVSNEIKMKGRPGRSKQRFGTKEGCLPMSQMEDEYKPFDQKDVDYFDFATLHEVGHAVDDNLGFMSSREGQVKFGGWKSHGGNVSEIVDAVAKKYEASELKQEIKDLILGKPVTWPTDNPAVQKIKDWHNLAKIRQPGNGAWWDQSESDKITLGKRIYQEAYANKWFSYDAAARKQGITGYQFRAPGEWFAELYAAYHIPVKGNETGKLKSSHPACKWLKDLKTS